MSDFYDKGHVTYEDLLAKPDDHSELGPSGMDRWIPCPGSVQLSRGRVVAQYWGGVSDRLMSRSRLEARSAET